MRASKRLWKTLKNIRENWRTPEKISTEDREYIEKFDGNLLWSRDFYGLTIHESICAVACPTSGELKHARTILNKSL